MYASTHAVLMANLELNGHVCGVQGFFMQLHDADGVFIPGLEVGDMGPKIGHREANIGNARFAHVRT